MEWVEKFKEPDTVGQCDPGTRVISLKRGEKDTFSTLIHEVLHAIQFEKGVKLTHKNIYELEGPLATVLRLNRLGRCR